MKMILFPLLALNVTAAFAHAGGLADGGASGEIPSLPPMIGAAAVTPTASPAALAVAGTEAPAVDAGVAAAGVIAAAVSAAPAAAAAKASPASALFQARQELKDLKEKLSVVQASAAGDNVHGIEYRDGSAGARAAAMEAASDIKGRIGLKKKQIAILSAQERGRYARLRADIYNLQQNRKRAVAFAQVLGKVPGSEESASRSAMEAADLKAQIQSKKQQAGLILRSNPGFAGLLYPYYRFVKNIFFPTRTEAEQAIIKDIRALTRQQTKAATLSLQAGLAFHETGSPQDGRNTAEAGAKADALGRQIQAKREQLRHIEFD